MQRIALGISDFKSLRDNKAYFVDKSFFIKEVIDENFQTILLPRPRRFGKTLNLSMLKIFFEKEKQNKSYLFDNLTIAKEPEFKDHFNRYPVIFLSFKDVKENNFEVAFDKIKKLIKAEFSKNSYLLKNPNFKKEDKIIFEDILYEKTGMVDYSNALLYLSKWLYEYHNEKVIILIDEYDTPIQSAFFSGFYDEMINFFRNFLSAGLKDNSYLFKAVLTGILRVARESIFSGLNNIGTYTILDTEFETSFGFTEPEVFKMLDDYEIGEFKDGVKKWYDGYIFGSDTTIYNPWSILNFVSKKEKVFEPFWVNTSSNDIIRDLVINSSMSIKKEFEYLLEDIPITKQIDSAIVFRDIEKNETSLYSFLLFCGYLKPFEKKVVVGENICKLLIPNLEVKTIFRKAFLNWFNQSFVNEKLQIMLKSLITGDLKLFERLLSEFVLTTLSYFDTAGKNIEAVYQAFVLGLLVSLPASSYEVNSNKESGFGRYDISIIPKDLSKKAIIMELKTIDDFYEETKEEALDSAVKQLVEKKYETEILKRGIKDILRFGVVFDGKRVWIKTV